MSRQIVDGSGIRPDPNKVEAIKSVPVPQNVSAVRRFLGMTNQLSKFVPDIADRTKPLRELLIKNRYGINPNKQHLNPLIVTTYAIVIRS